MFILGGGWSAPSQAPETYMGSLVLCPLNSSPDWEGLCIRSGVREQTFPSPRRAAQGAAVAVSGAGLPPGATGKVEGSSKGKSKGEVPPQPPRAVKSSHEPEEERIMSNFSAGGKAGLPPPPRPPQERQRLLCLFPNSSLLSQSQPTGPGPHPRAGWGMGQRKENSPFPCPQMIPWKTNAEIVAQ